MEEKRLAFAAVLVAGATFGLLALAGCSQPGSEVNASAPAPAVNVKLVAPHQGEIARHITLPANVRAYQQATLYAKVAGYLKSISVDKGDSVQAGAALAEVEVPELLADETRGKAEVEVAKIDY